MLVPVQPATIVGASTGVPATQPHDIGSTYGAMTLGTYLGLMLYGATIYQIYWYRRLYSNDPSWIKVLVCGIFMLDTLHMFASIVAMCVWVYAPYYHLITNFMNPMSLSAGHWSMRVLTPTTGFSLVICQSFYAVRVYRIEKRYIYRLFVGAAVVSMICSFGFTIAATIEGSHGSLSMFQEVSWLVGSMFGFAMLADICLAGTLVVVLLRSRTGFKSTDSTIDTIIVYTINTGLLTSVVGLPCFVFSLVLPGNLIYAGLSIVGVKLYANSVLAVLNSRRSLANRMFEGRIADMVSFELDHTEHAVRSSRAYAPRMTMLVPRPLLSNEAISASRDEGVIREIDTVDMQDDKCYGVRPGGTTRMDM